MSKRTPYDTGKRSEPKVWGRGHIEDEDDYGKVDFEDDAGGTLATLYIEQSDDRTTYTLKGWTNESLKIDIDCDEDATVTMAAEEEGSEGIETIHWFPDDLVMRTVGMVPEYGQVVQAERAKGITTLWVLCPGTGLKQWDEKECRLLHRVNKNKEGQ